MEKGRVIFVTGSTGQQGGAAMRHLLQNGFRVKALTRNTDSPKSASIKEKGVEFVEGDLFKPETFEKHIKGVYGVFAVQNFWEHGYEGEITQGELLIDVAKQAGVKHYVYTSVASANKHTGLAHFESKFKIENYLKQSGLDYTIIRPVFFMDNFRAMHSQIMQGRLINALGENTPLQMIAVNDVGAFVAQAFMYPDIFLKKEIDIAGDSKTMTEVARIFSEELNEKISYVKLDTNEYKNIMGEEYAKMAQWFERVGYDVDIEALRANYDVELTGFREWLKAANFEQYKVRQQNT